MRNKKRKYRWTLRKYIAIVSILTLINSLIFSAIIALAIMKVFYKGDVSNEIMIIVSIIAIILSLIISGISLWIGAGHLTKPLVELSDAVKQVAEGNFKVNIKRRNTENCKYEYITEVDELARNVNKMVKELDSMDYMRKDFMSNVSHEIKTPIAAISGLSEILLDENISKEKQRQYLKLINNESMRVSRLCEYMLNMSRLDSQVIVINKKEIQLDEQIRKSVILLCEKWNDLDIDFEIDLQSIIIKSDADMLQQVWINIIENSIKYSKEDCKIIISAKEINNETIEVKIMDNGVPRET